MAGRRTTGVKPGRPGLVVVAALVLVVAAAWAMQAVVAHRGGAAEPSSAAPPYSITVEQGGKVLKRYDLAALHALPQSRAVVDGKEQDGPALQTVLADAGASGYSRLTLKGVGLRDAGHLMVSSAVAARGVMLDFSDRGTVKVCGGALDRAQWVRDLLSITAE